MIKSNHGHARRKQHTGAYKSWANMIKRCFCKSCIPYKYYGGRGITVCESWRDYAAFFADMGDRPDGFSLERIDVNGDYCPSNCKWIPIAEQALNMRSNTPVTIDGITKTITAWAIEAGLPYNTVYLRIRRGMPAAEAITRPYYQQPTAEMGRKKRADAGIKRGKQKNPAMPDR